MRRDSGWARIGSVVFVAALAAAGTAFVATEPAEAAKKGPKVKLSQIGRPAWKPSDFHIFTHTVAADYSDFMTIAGTLLPPPNHVPVTGLGIGPGAAHAGPYTHEFADTMDSLGLSDQTTFTVDQFTIPNAIWLDWMTSANEKGAVPTGRTPDSNSGPMIPNSLFPFALRGNLSRDGELFDGFFRVDVPVLDKNVDPRFDGMDGHSHFPMFIAEDQSYGPAGQPRTGKYLLHLVQLDAQGNGWSMDWSFTVK